jgi:hypothetical protein
MPAADVTVTVVYIQTIIIEQNFHTNFGKQSGTETWNLNVWTRITNNSDQIFNGTIEIKGTQGSTIVTHSGAISIDPGTARYPGNSSTWTLYGFPDKTSTLVEIWIYDTFGNLVSYGSKTQT